LKRIPAFWLALLLIGLILTTYAGTFNHLFVYWDDNSAIVENPDLNPPTPASLAKFWKDPLHGYRGFYVPVPYTIWWVAAHIDRLPSGNGTSTMPNEAVFHGLNLAFHTAGALLLFALLRRLVGKDMPALIGAMVFALHPLQADPVCWASSMYTPLSAMLGLAGWLLYIRFADLRVGLRPKQEIRNTKSGINPESEGEMTGMSPGGMDAPIVRRFGFSNSLLEFISGFGFRISSFSAVALYSAAMLCYVLALLTKATIVLLPLIIALVEVTLRGRRLKSCLALVPWMLLALGAGLLTHHTQLAQEVYVPAVWLRPLVAADALAFYLFKLVVPVGLVPDYGHSPKWALAQGAIAVTWILPVLVGVTAWHLRRRFPWLWVSAAVFMAGLLPTLGFVPYDYQFYSTVADRYSYFAMIGPAMAAAFLLRHLTAGSSVSESNERQRFRLRALVAAEVACLLLALVCRMQVRHWSDTRELFRHTLAVNPNSMIAHRQLGFVMLLGEAPDEAEEAIAHYRASLKLFPEDGGALSNLGLLLTRQHRPAEAVEVFRTATMIRPKEAPIHYNLGNALVAAGRYDEAVVAYAHAIEIAPGFFDSNMRLADAMAADGQKDVARTHYLAALRVRPRWRAAVAGLIRLSGSPGPVDASVNPRE
jgi:tetratricopeptide (TPR) repeat protein